MNTNSVEQLNIKEKGLNLYKTYKFLEKFSTEALSKSINEFWEVGIDLKLINISKNQNIFSSGSEYFVTRIKLSKQDQFVIKLSKETVQILLDSTLGYNPEFNFENITELEAKILTSFNNLIYTNFSNNLYSKEEVAYFESEGETTNNECNFTFYLKDLSETPAKILISLPEKYLKSEEVALANNMFGIDDFPNAKANVNLFLGTTTLPLTDIKNIEKEDIIVLENSNINKMLLKFENNEMGFKVSPDPSLIISFDNNNEDKNMSSAENIWDNIQVEISAEFENVKISLGEIKQISEGLVLDIGSIYENKVYLKVENKPVAEGELVIINDRYGVKVNKIINDDKDVSTTENIEEQVMEEPQEIQQNIEESSELQQDVSSENSDEFDYKDFDVDDENI